MAKELAFALITPYSIAKSRTGGIIGRFMSRTGLELVAARMFGPSPELVERYADSLEGNERIDPAIRPLLGDYVRRALGPDPRSGRRRRVMMLLFEGEDAVEKIYRTAGPIRPDMEAGETIRDTFGDYVLGDNGLVRYIEPAVFVGPDPASAMLTMRLWSDFGERDGGLIGDAADVLNAADAQRTLVLIKPDNFRFPSARPGNIIDLFSRSGLRIVGAKVHRMSVAEAEAFYGPVREVLRTKLNSLVAERATHALTQELGIELPETLRRQLGEQLGPYYGDQQFSQIVHFMTGVWPQRCPDAEKTQPGRERCLALVYAGADAVERIRGILGPTDPSKAQPGSVRREFGQDIMINAAHASDSPENAAREMAIVGVERDTVKAWVDLYTKRD